MRQAITKQHGFSTESSHHKRAFDADFFNRVIRFSVCETAQRKALNLMVSHLAKVFAVGADEVAFLVLDRHGETLHFFRPEYLLQMGATVPVDHPYAICGESLRTRKPIIRNSLLAVNHLTYFEKIPREGNVRSARIEKMLTYPIYLKDYPMGVVQISRKLSMSVMRRPNFYRADVEPMKNLENVLARLFQNIRSMNRDL